jgi:hypothetical protein
MAAYGLGQKWCNYHAEWTPSAGAQTVSYSAYMAIQKNNYGSSDITSYGGIAIRGKKANLTEVALGGIQLMLNGGVNAWGYPDGTYTNLTSSYANTLDQWSQLKILVNFENDMLYFSVGGNPVGSLAFGSDVVQLSSIALYCGASDKWSLGNNVRFDTINVDAIPEPATICLFGLGGLSLVRRKK